MTDRFVLDAKLEADSAPVGETELCFVRLARDARYPWAILIPKRAGCRELHDLAPADQVLLMGEITHIAKAMQAAWRAEKTNVASLGNQVAQLHIHIVMRHAGDAAWPGPIWGRGEAEPYDENTLEEARARLRGCLP
jgi:diadenosine tetraphosphate (Ap4A) HIT family hydrolase